MTNEIIDKILLHKEVYGYFHRVVPPYRMTCDEHRKLYKYITSMWENEGFPPAMLGSWMGVEIEVVMIVEPYL